MIAVTTALSASSTSIIGLALAAGITVSAAPNIRPKKMTPSMSVSAAARIGLRGTMFTSVSMPNVDIAAASTRLDASFLKRSISWTRVSGLTRSHGRIRLTMTSPSVAARQVVMKK